MTVAFTAPPDLRVPDQKILPYLEKINWPLALSSIPRTPSKESSHNFATM